jgi:phosphoribosylglycinamide formyltransferase-1
MVNIAVFASGNGTNCENIIRYFAQSTMVHMALVVSNKADAPVLTRAQRWNVPTAIMPRADFNDKEKLLPLLKQHNIGFIVLAGFLLMIPTFLIEAYPRGIINIHPALLPKFGGKGIYGHHVHEAVWAAHEKETGMTVHWVNEQCDGGDIIAQYRVSLTPEDTPETIAAKEHELEMTYYPKVIEHLLS